MCQPSVPCYFLKERQERKRRKSQWVLTDVQRLSWLPHMFSLSSNPSRELSLPFLTNETVMAKRTEYITTISCDRNPSMLDFRAWHPSTTLSVPSDIALPFTSAQVCSGKNDRAVRAGTGAHRVAMEAKCWSHPAVPNRGMRADSRKS